METVGVYAGSFDPPTLGHLDIIQRSLQFCDKTIVGIGENSSKKTQWGNLERAYMVDLMVKLEMKSQSSRIFTHMFSGLLIDYARLMGANILIRGIRSVSDFEYEINLANINKTLAPELETIFLPTSPTLGVVSSSAVKEIMKYNGDVSKFVSPEVYEYMLKEMKISRATAK